MTKVCLSVVVKTILPRQKFCHVKHTFVATRVLLLQTHVNHDKNMPVALSWQIFVSTYIMLSRQTLVCRNLKHNCHNKSFVTSILLSQQKYTQLFVMTKLGLLRETQVCHDKHNFVATSTFLSQQNIFLWQLLSQQTILSWQKLCHDKLTFVTRKAVFCHAKHICHVKTCVTTKLCLLQHKTRFVLTKHHFCCDRNVLVTWLLRQNYVFCNKKTPVCHDKHRIVSVWCRMQQWCAICGAMCNICDVVRCGWVVHKCDMKCGETWNGHMWCDVKWLSNVECCGEM